LNLVFKNNNNENMKSIVSSLRIHLSLVKKNICLTSKMVL
jgi:hypothetical protein